MGTKFQFVPFYSSCPLSGTVNCQNGRCKKSTRWLFAPSSVAKWYTPCQNGRLCLKMRRQKGKGGRTISPRKSLLSKDLKFRWGHSYFISPIQLSTSLYTKNARIKFGTALTVCTPLTYGTSFWSLPPLYTIFILFSHHLVLCILAVRIVTALTIPVQNTTRSESKGRCVRTIDFTLITCVTHPTLATIITTRTTTILLYLQSLQSAAQMIQLIVTNVWIMTTRIRWW